MKVVLVTRHLGLPVGFGTYARGLLRGLATLGDEDEYVVLTPRFAAAPVPRGVRLRTFPVPRLRSALYAWDLTGAAAAAVRERPDVIHYLHPGYPLAGVGRPVLVSVLDAIPWVLPGYALPRAYDALERRAARRADRILTLSESAAGDLERLLGVPRAKIDVAYLGSPSADDRPVAAEPYWLFVGGTERRKNLAAVLAAFAHGGFDGMRLKVVGAHEASPIHASREELLAAIPAPAHERVDWLGSVAPAELEDLYRRATALVFPSLYEGFGLPVTEAMARHTPVVASDRSSLPEVTRDAALTVDPDDPAALAAAMRRLLEDDRIRARLVERGLEVAGTFTWEDTAGRTLAAYRKSLEAR